MGRPMKYKFDVGSKVKITLKTIHCDECRIDDCVLSGKAYGKTYYIACGRSNDDGQRFYYLRNEKNRQAHCSIIESALKGAEYKWEEL